MTRQATSGFADHFGGVARGYAEFRPTYPAELFTWLSSVAPSRRLAWDCASGSGQAALALADHFDRVIATDASAAQIAQAQPHARVEYRVVPAEQTDLEDRSADLVTVAQALHWFDVPHFHGEVRRILKPRGVIAEWAYGLTQVDHGEIDRLVSHFYSGVVGAYWPANRVHIERGYADLPFPFERLAAPDFAMEVRWTLEQFTGYLRTWSATSRYRAALGIDPVDALEAQLRPHWGSAGRSVRWPLMLRAGTIRPSIPLPNGLDLD